MKKKEANKITGKDLKFKYFDLAKSLAGVIINEMRRMGLGAQELPQVLHDLNKFIILAEAETSKENALYVINRIVELDSDLTMLMMRIVENHLEQMAKEGKEGK